MKTGYSIIILFCALMISTLALDAQSQQTDTLRGKNIYNPQRFRSQDTIPIPVVTAEQTRAMQDSIAMRSQFVRDSLMAREQFMRDSIVHRQRIMDSLVWLQRELQWMLNAYFRTVKEDIILNCRSIAIAGDSALGDFEYTILPFGTTDPYTPWKVKIPLSGNSVQIAVNEKNQIVSVKSSRMHASFTYTGGEGLMVIQEPVSVQNNWAGNFYKVPVDTVFFDRYRRITKIKKYVQFYSVISGNQKGTPLFLNRVQVKQYEYDTDNQVNQYQVVKFCERWKAYESNKVCSILTFTFSKQGNAYLLTRRNDPANSYSDGTFTFVFDDAENLTGISFKNLANTENWQRLIELNKDGNVSCYIDKTNDIIRQSLCMIYHDKDAGAKHSVETVTTTFEKDGISYFQKNNTTDKIRTRDKMTLEWSPWH